jgi:hypothetical protein
VAENRSQHCSRRSHAILADTVGITLRLQVALAFYLINLQNFGMETALSIARDRIVGILLGLFMWLVFD